MTINRILIANRGEIALRIQSACERLGIEAVQIHSEADADSLPVTRADTTVCLPGASVSETYGNIDAVVEAARRTGCDAVHPGYGFLSENAEFAEACAAANLIFIGPDAEVIRQMGDKAMARLIAQRAGVPVIPGTDGPVSVDEGRQQADRIGYPILIKAAAGGGGRGMRVVSDAAAFDAAAQGAIREAESSFGSGAIYLERYLERVRHVEVQVFGDGTRFIHLGERDCSTQRRHQKLVEEAPSPSLSAATADRIRKSAVRLAAEVGYCNAGTVEFVVDADSEEFFFIEMNTRIQVEHPVTEAITGRDLVAEQISVADGSPLSWTQDEIAFSGHAIECRINAEDPEKGFLPRPGTVAGLDLPKAPWLRIDTHLFDGYALPTAYDSMLAKVVTHGATRDQAIDRMKQVLRDMRIDGLRTTIPFLQRLMEDEGFLNGRVHTRYVREVMWAGKPMQQML